MSSSDWETDGTTTGPARRDARGARDAERDRNSTIEAHLGIVHRYAYRQCRDEDMAAEVVLHTFEVVRRRLDGSELYDLSIAWVLGVARNKVRECRRRRRAQRWLERAISSVWPQGLPEDKQPFQAAPAPAPQDCAVAAEEARCLAEAIDALPDDQREAILLRYTLQLSIADIAEIMGRTVKSVDGLLARARRRLYEATRRYFEQDREGGCVE